MRGVARSMGRIGKSTALLSSMLSFLSCTKRRSKPRTTRWLNHLRSKLHYRHRSAAKASSERSTVLLCLYDQGLADTRAKPRAKPFALYHLAVVERSPSVRLSQDNDRQTTKTTTLLSPSCAAKYINVPYSPSRPLKNNTDTCAQSSLDPNGSVNVLHRSLSA